MFESSIVIVQEEYVFFLKDCVSSVAVKMENMCKDGSWLVAA